MGDIRRLSPPGLKEELVANEEDEKNWKGIVIALLVISTICSFILLSIFLLTPHMNGQNKKELLKLEDFILEGYEVKHYNGSWISADELIYKDQNGSICLYNIRNRSKRQLLDGTSTRQYEVQRYSVSNDSEHRFLMLVHDIKKMGHHSSLARYTIFDTKLHTFTPLKIKDFDQHQYGVWVPGRTLIIIVNRNNIYLFTPMNDIIHQLTEPKNDLIWNGIADMAYEEHIWNSNIGTWLNSYVGGWSMLYLTIDNTHVEQMPYVVYGRVSSDNSSTAGGAAGIGSSSSSSTSAASGSSSMLVSASYPYQATINNQTEKGNSLTYAPYPKVYSYPYPKAGKPLPRITLSVTKVSDSNQIRYKSQQVTPPAIILEGGKSNEYYLSSPPVWLSHTEIVTVWTRRRQDLAVISICREQNDWKCEQLTSEKMLRHDGSLVLQSSPVISANGQQMFLRMPVNDGNAGTFDHIALVTRQGQKQILTHGPYEVTHIFAYRQDISTLYYAATTDRDPGARHIYKLVYRDSWNKDHNISCISCKVNASCLYNHAIFSPDARHFIMECLGPDFPIYYLVETDSESVVEVLHDNSQLRHWAGQRSIPKIRHFIIPTPDQFHIRLQLIIPVEVNELDDAKYPLVIETNRMPGLQESNHLNKLDWLRYLTSRRDYITARIDTRGSGFQGFRHQYSVYRRLGDLELEDVRLALAFIKQLPYVDSQKIAVWGQEFGGYLATAILAKESSVACSVAVSPITSWKNYLSVFSERYMGLPSENFLDYEKSELMGYSSKLKGKTLLVVHGNVNRRVNIQNSMQLMKSLIDNAVQYQTQIYPDNGSLETWDLLVRYHFYRKMEDFFAHCFQVEEDEDEDDILPITKVIKGRIKQV